MDIREFLESKDTYKTVMEVLARESGLSLVDVASKIKEDDEDKPWNGELKIDGFIAGGSVANILNYLKHGVKAVVRDVDIFYPYNRTSNIVKNVGGDLFEKEYVQDGWVDSDMEEFRQAFESELSVDGDWYGNKWVQPNGDFCLMKSHFRQGMANYVEIHVGIGGSKKIEDTNKLRDMKHMIILKGFDINSCQVGIDIVNEKLVYTEGFLEFLESRQMKVTIPVNPIQTSIRLIKKIKDMEAYCDINNELKLLQYSVFCVDNISNRFGSETYNKYLEHKEYIDKFFQIVKIEKIKREEGFNNRGLKYGGTNGETIPTLQSDGIGRGFHIDGKDLWIFAPKLKKYELKYHFSHPLSLINYWRMNEEHVGKVKKRKIQVILDKLYADGIKPYVETANGYGSWSVKTKENVTETLLKFETNNSHKYKVHGVNIFSELGDTRIHKINHWLWHNLVAHTDYFDCDFHTKHIDFINTFMEEHRGLRWFFDNSPHWGGGSARAVGKTLQDQYKAMKMVKTISNKRGDWIIGELENMNYDKREDLMNAEDQAKFINDYMSNIEVALSKPLTEPIDLTGFEHADCVTEIYTTKDLRSEGTRMGHCVGGYTTAIKDGRSKIFHIECDGVGSTLEIGFGTNIWPKFGSAKAREIGEDWIEYGSREDIRRLRKLDSSIEKAGFNNRQHYGRYPEKGNLTPTDTNKEIAKKLIEFLDSGTHLEDKVKDILWTRHQLEEKIRKDVWTGKVKFENEEKARKARELGKEVVTVTDYGEWDNNNNIPSQIAVRVDEVLHGIL